MYLFDNVIVAQHHQTVCIKPDICGSAFALFRSKPND
jgi:hypothetical protein